MIGATGGTGKFAVEMAPEAGREVTAFARDPAAVTEKHPRLRVAKGDASYAADATRPPRGRSPAGRPLSCPRA